MLILILLMVFIRFQIVNQIIQYNFQLSQEAKKKIRTKPLGQGLIKIILILDENFCEFIYFYINFNYLKTIINYLFDYFNLK